MREVGRGKGGERGKKERVKEGRMQKREERRGKQKRTGPDRNMCSKVAAMLVERGGVDTNLSGKSSEPHQKQV